MNASGNSAAIGIVLGLVAGAALAQGVADAYPSKPVVMVIPFPPGGPTDLDARLYTQKLTENMRQQFLLDYRPGAGSTLGTAYVAKVAPDGYTLLVVTTGFNVAPAMYRSLPYDSVADFAPVALLTKRSSLLVVHPSLPVKSVAEYVAYARANPGKLNFGTPGSGGAPHLAGEWLHNLTNTKATFVHYKGTAQMVLDLVAGRLDAAISVPAGVLAHARSGKLRLLASSGAERSKLLADVPTIAEGGVAGYDYTGGLGVLAPRGTPAPIVNKLSAEFARVSKSPDVFQKLAEDGNVLTVSSTPEQFRQHILTEVTRWRKVVADSGIKLEE